VLTAAVAAAALAGLAASASAVDARAGRVAFAGTAADGTTQVFSVRPDASGPLQLTKTAKVDNLDPAWSPDGTRVAFATDERGGYDIGVMNADGGDRKVLPDAAPAGQSGPADDRQPAWSPDGKALALVREVDGPLRELVVMGADGSAPTVVTSADDLDRPSWSPDGKLIAYSARAVVSDRLTHHVFAVAPTPDASPTDLTAKDAGDDLDPTWSPDGTRIGLVQNGDLAVLPAGGGQPGVIAQTPLVESHPSWYPDGATMVAEVSPPPAPPALGPITAALAGPTLVNVDASGVETNLVAGATPDVQILPPLPSLTQLLPAQAQAGSGGLTLRVVGAAFVKGLSTVRWNKTALATTFVSATQLDAQVPAADLAAAGTASVDVATTVAGEPLPVLTAALTFTITPAVTPPPGGGGGGGGGASGGGGGTSGGGGGGVPVPPVAGAGGSAAPTITAILPKAPLPGDLVTLTGDFGGRPTDVIVGGQRAVIVSASGTRVSVLVPGLPPGPADVTLIVGGRRVAAPTPLAIRAAPNQPPVPNLVSFPAPRGLGFVFDATLSLDPEGLGGPAQGLTEQALAAGLRSVLWHFGDGGSSTRPVVTHVYSRPGTYHVTLTVTDETGRSATSGEDVQAVSPGAGGGRLQPVNIRIPSQIVFNFGSFVLRPDSRHYLLRVSKVVRRAFGRTRVAGHTDDIGPPAFNRTLSLRRAKVVRSFLSLRGRIAPRRLRAVGYGESHPLASNASVIGRQRNRRVVLTFRLPNRSFARV
jgi:outer membrane protein OmpA-like peptidoglycan-associated protein